MLVRPRRCQLPILRIFLDLQKTVFIVRNTTCNIINAPETSKESAVSNHSNYRMPTQANVISSPASLTTTPRDVSVLSPPFSPERPGLWFAQLEHQFRIRSIIPSLSQFF